ncbi:putative fimbrial adhesin YadC [Escherichia coli H588]|nr:putative fimbrial adhesin YadC [Escherichia coli H588]
MHIENKMVDSGKSYGGHKLFKHLFQACITR